MLNVKKYITFKNTTAWVMGAFYINIGVKHFTDPNFFLKIMPPYLPWHLELVYLSGIFEIIFGFMLFIPLYRKYAGWLLILLLIAVFPANIYLAQTNGEALAISKEIAWGRLPFQLVFLGLAYYHTKD